MEYWVALVQGIYFVVFVIWPILHMKSFLIVTGPKTDLWLVKTSDLILAVIGVVLLHAWINGHVNPAVILLAIGSALSLALVEFVYIPKRVISPSYLLDALAELVLIGGGGSASCDNFAVR